MAEAATPTPTPIHYTSRLTPAQAEAADYEWRASSVLGERHAFPPVDGFRRSICDRRVAFTAAFGHHGATTCPGCRAALREQLRATAVALAAIGISTAIATPLADDDQAGDHFRYADRDR
jgi:predicted nucleic acid-binding Zn ribbon protein